MDNNILEFIGSISFKGLNKLTYLSLKGNQIIAVHPDAFVDNAELTNFFLQNNRIESLNGCMIPDTMTLLVEDNPIVCDCRMSWVLDHHVLSRPVCELDNQSIILQGCPDMCG